MKLSSLTSGQSARLTKIQGSAEFVERMMEIGICPGVEVVVDRHLPFRGPMVLKYLSTRMALRIQDADNIEVNLL